MCIPTPNSSHSRALNTVIDYIHTHLDEELTVNLLAKQTSLSAYHFHRIFTKEVGESLAKYILRKRLELAANLLKSCPSKPISNIAYEVGFNSVNVFCRNFKKHLGVTAAAYRSKKELENRKNNLLEGNFSLTHRKYSSYFCSDKTIIIKNKTMNCKFELKTLPAMHVAYCRHQGAYNQIQDAFAKLMQWAYPRGLVNSPLSKLIAVYHDNPEVTETKKLTSDACITIKELIKPEGEIGTYTLPGGLCAIGRFKLKMEDFPEAWNTMYHLIFEHGCECDTALPFEIYHNNGSEAPNQLWTTDICIPIVKK